jgi:NhaA family Na+:H+ antiporter
MPAGRVFNAFDHTAGPLAKASGFKMTALGYKRFSLSLMEFFKTSAAGGVVLVFAAALSMVMANSEARGFYQHLLHMPVSIMFGEVGLSKTLHHWINDGLMAIFFFMVGMEIKHEAIKGHLSTRDQAILPALAALGGMAVPAAVFYLIVKAEHPALLHGWAIPSATDIAFALGILALLGDRVPAALKVLLMAIAVIDDLGAVVIIALFYTADLSYGALGLAACCIALLFALNRFRVKSAAAYVLTGILLWLAVLESGVHATLAGVITAFFIPITEDGVDGDPRDGRSMLEGMVHKLHPWVAFLIMPVFAFANAGVNLDGLSLENMRDPVPLGIAAGLFAGKQVGIFATILIAVKLGVSALPRLVSWRHIYGLSLLCGIGFTMSLFIGSLAYHDPLLNNEVRLGVLAGSTLSAVIGYFFLRYCTGNQTYIDEDN